jgi:UDP-N-acetyl-D-glucosamine/UDP-N-acetyl-D-galactosamine dehydrogenase
MKNIKIAVIGLGYVGLPVAVLFAKKYSVVGYDINKQRIKDLNNYKDDTLEITSSKLRESLNKNLNISDEIEDIKNCNFYIITVPTPINKNKTPNLLMLLNATKTVGKYISKGNIVIYESTVYPGCTEEECVPILEKKSKLKFNSDFYCGYSPERINPGDKKHTIEKIIKITSGSSPETADKIDKLYSSVIKAGTYKASSIKVAEAAKVIENAQRDINIAFVNELSIIFSKMNIDTNDVLNAASSKWNFLNFKPGLVGGHCIGVDPHYLADKSISLGYKPEIILAGRYLNDNMGGFIADEVISLLRKSTKQLNRLKVLVLGVTFKENCPDYRNTKVVNVISKLKLNGLKVDAYDPWVNTKSFYQDHNLVVYDHIPNTKYNAIILAVSHDSFRKIDLNKIKADNNTVIYDIKGFFNKNLVTKRL